MRNGIVVTYSKADGIIVISVVRTRTMTVTGATLALAAPMIIDRCINSIRADMELAVYEAIGLMRETEP